MQFENMEQFTTAINDELLGAGSLSDVSCGAVFGRNNIAFMVDEGQGMRELIYKNVPQVIRHLATDKSSISVSDCLARLIKHKEYDWLPVVRYTPDKQGSPGVFLEKLNSLNLGPDTISPALYWKASMEAYTYLHIQWAAFFHLYPFFLGFDGSSATDIDERIQMVTFQELIDTEDWTGLWAQKMRNFNPFIIDFPK